jgi:hypothetical protein
MGEKERRREEGERTEDGGVKSFTRILNFVFDLRIAVCCAAGIADTFPLRPDTIIQPWPAANRENTPCPEPSEQQQPYSLVEQKSVTSSRNRRGGQSTAGFCWHHAGGAIEDVYCYLTSHSRVVTGYT